MTPVDDSTTGPRKTFEQAHVAQQLHGVLHRLPGAEPGYRADPGVHRLQHRQRPLPRAGEPVALLQQTAVVGTLAVGQTLIILTAGIDLSIGAVMVLASLVMAKLVSDNGVPGLAGPDRRRRRGAGGGTINGLLVTRIKLPPFIVTLGTLSHLHGDHADLRPGPDHPARTRTRSCSGPARPSASAASTSPSA